MTYFYRRFCGLFVFAAFVVLAGNLFAQSTNYVNFEGKQTSPIRLSPDGTRLFAVNTPDARLSVFDVSNPSNPILMAEIPVGLEPVSVHPLNNDEAWVVNEVSDSVSIVSVSQHLVTDTLSVKDEPVDVVFAAGKAFVTASRKNQIAVFDQVSHVLLTNIAVFGENPRALAVSLDGTKVYAAFALSGNRTTLIPPSLAPPPPPPTNPNLPAPPQVSLIVDAADSAWTNVIKFTMPDNDVVEINTSTLAINRYFSRVGTINLGLAVHPTSGDLYVANTEARNLTRFEPVLRGNFVTNRVTRISATSGAVMHFDLNPGFTFTNFPNRSNQTNALAQPTAIVFLPSGTNLYVTAFGTDRVARMDTNGNILARIEIGNAVGSNADPRNKRGPRGLALGPVGSSRLYVLNRFSNTISIIDTATDTVLRELPTGSFDPTPTVVRNGRGFLYDAKLSGHGTVSCASCHIDAEMDLIAWDLGNPGGTLDTVKTTTVGIPTNLVMHPMKGPMTTQTLRGLKGMDPLHWRGDRTNFQHFSGAFDSLLGGSVLASNDMLAYRDYINTIALESNPNQNLDRTLPASFAGGNPNQGRSTFMNVNYFNNGIVTLKCITCHLLPTGSDFGHTPAAVLFESQAFKVPHLRNIYQKTSFTGTNLPGAQTIGGFGVTHDGVEASVFSFVSSSNFFLFSNDTIKKTDLNAFVLCLDTGTAPAVGYARTLTPPNVNTTSVSNDWNLLETQAVALTNIDLIVKGTLDGKRRGLIYQPAQNNYRADKIGVGPFTRAQLRIKILAGDKLTIMGVPSGSGYRMGIDRNQDGLLDGDIAPPALEITRTIAAAVVSWATNVTGFVLERADKPSSTNWLPETSLRGTNAGKFSVTHSLSSSNLFFRLREL